MIPPVSGFYPQEVKVFRLFLNPDWAVGTLGVGEFFRVLTLGIVGIFFWRSPPGESQKKLERVG
ncbi:hypothetical protein H6G37_00595 [Synechocystis sp. FACHB-898]|uniref:hypothetical protein n=1 Tax=Synechocystis sp. FACHB-929 TaxID=2692867 RepID=UPI0002F0F28F|nr:hypothetical protein [Synechocystis sp. FACHB-929]MBD2616720.1 hypothetical protein [Synechocystis sp. FACHB-898]MBD2638034.1 hypothetical protein [Synechocystis sp. FACHB-908]